MRVGPGSPITSLMEGVRRGVFKRGASFHDPLWTTGSTAPCVLIPGLPIDQQNIFIHPHRRASEPEMLFDDTFSCMAGAALYRADLARAHTICPPAARREAREKRALGEAPAPGAETRGFSDIVLATGSGGTVAGVALGNHLTRHGARVWAFGACDSPSWHHSFIDRQILPFLLPSEGPHVGLHSEDLAEIRNAKNRGRAWASRWRKGASSVEPLSAGCHTHTF